jgi:hypothetical protein
VKTGGHRKRYRTRVYARQLLRNTQVCTIRIHFLFRNKQKPFGEVTTKPFESESISVLLFLLYMPGNRNWQSSQIITTVIIEICEGFANSFSFIFESGPAVIVKFT